MLPHSLNYNMDLSLAPCRALPPAIFQGGITAFKSYYNISCMREIMSNTQHGVFLMVIRLSYKLLPRQAVLAQSMSSWQIHTNLNIPTRKTASFFASLQDRDAFVCSDNVDINPLAVGMGFELCKFQFKGESFLSRDVFVIGV